MELLCGLEFRGYILTNIAGYYRVTTTIGKSWSEALKTKTSSTFRVYEEELERTIIQTTTLDVTTITVVEFE